jgi:hypothetical protein
MQNGVMEVQRPFPALRVPLVDTAAAGALMAQARQPFIIRHNLAASLGWQIRSLDTESVISEGDAASVLQNCRFAQLARWHALLSPDGVVGYYDRSRWAVEVMPPFDQEEECVSPTGPNVSRTELRWRSLVSENAEFPASCKPPRHVCTPDCKLESALSFWDGSSAAPFPSGQCASQPIVYIRGALPTTEAEQLQAGSVFEELRSMHVFGAEPFRATLYASRSGLQTNLHADEHSGFLVQVSGVKRVVLFSPKAARSLRCASWGDSKMPYSRRSWFDDGVPDEAEWASKHPFVGLGGCEVEIGSGDALYIPRGFFHDVLSRSSETLGIVLRCSD